MDLLRAVISVRFVWTVLFIFVVMEISSYGYIDPRAHVDVFYLLGGAIGASGSSIFLFCIAPIMPFGTAFATDVEDKAYPFWVVRTGISGYSSSKFVAAALSGFLSIAAGIGLFTLIMSFFFPFFIQINSGNPYVVLLETNQPGAYLVLIMIHFGLSGTLFAGGAMAVSAYIPNKFSVVAIPVVVFWVLMRVTSIPGIPEILQIGIIVQAFTGTTPWAAMLNKLVPTLLILIALFGLFRSKIRRRMLNT
jgi:hypothetical protein